MKMRIEVNGKRVFFDIEGPEYIVDGNGLRKLPTLIVIHGSPGNSDHSVFKPAFSALRDVAQVVYLDLSGAGRSDDEPSGKFSLDQWADDLVEFCALLEIEKPVVLGVSAGGFVAMAYGIRYPDHPGGLILASTQAKLNVDRSLAEFRRIGGDEVEAAARTLLKERVDGETSLLFGEVCMPHYNTTPQPTRDSIVFRTLLAMEFHKLDGIWHDMDLRDDLHRITAPTLVLAGDQDPITPLQDSKDIVERMSKDVLEFVSIPGTGHGPWRDKPDETFTIIRQFLSAH